MIRNLRAFFLGRLLREKLLLVAFIGLGMLWWLSSFGAQVTRFWRSQGATTAALKEQEFWITNRAIIDASAQKAASRLVPEKTLDATRLVNAVNQAAAEAGLRSNQYNSTGGTDETNEQFTIHSLNYQVTGADYGALLKFYLNLQQRAPYIGIGTFALSSTRANPTLLNLQLKVSSVEVAR
ncbi:MAG: hypothetical protein HY736_16780 [Verrucomicrobia bacterium]|nr:hypothetical protein [Verrucomicrobiota bacterium]